MQNIYLVLGLNGYGDPRPEFACATRELADELAADLNRLAGSEEFTVLELPLASSAGEIARWSEDEVFLDAEGNVVTEYHRAQWAAGRSWVKEGVEQLSKGPFSTAVVRALSAQGRDHAIFLGKSRLRGQRASV